MYGWRLAKQLEDSSRNFEPVRVESYRWHQTMTIKLADGASVPQRFLIRIFGGTCYSGAGTESASSEETGFPICHGEEALATRASSSLFPRDHDVATVHSVNQRMTSFGPEASD